MTEGWAQIVASLVSALLGGLIVAVVNHLFGKKKLAAEVSKLEAEVGKIEAERQKSEAERQKLAAETNKIEVERRNLERVSTAFTYQVASATEKILYDSRGRDKEIGHDFDGKPDCEVDDQGRDISELGAGSLTFASGGILNIHRENVHGRFKVELKRYKLDQGEREFIPRDERLAGSRSFRVSCEAKAMDAEHTLRFLLKDVTKNLRVTWEDRKISSNAWTEVSLYLRGVASEDYTVRIDDVRVTNAPSSVQIRNFQLAEKSV